MRLQVLLLIAAFVLTLSVAWACAVLSELGSPAIQIEGVWPSPIAVGLGADSPQVSVSSGMGLRATRAEASCAVPGINFEHAPHTVAQSMVEAGWPFLCLRAESIGVKPDSPSSLPWQTPFEWSHDWSAGLGAHFAASPIGLGGTRVLPLFPRVPALLANVAVYFAALQVLSLSYAASRRRREARSLKAAG